MCLNCGFVFREPMVVIIRKGSNKKVTMAEFIEKYAFEKKKKVCPNCNSDAYKEISEGEVKRKVKKKVEERKEGEGIEQISDLINHKR